MTVAPEGTDPEDGTVGLIVEQTRRFLAREIDPAAIEAGGRIPERVVAAARDVGLFALTIPEAHGGLGLSLRAACPVVSEIARVDRSVAVMVGLHVGLGTRALVRHGTPEQQSRWLPALAAGERVASFAATEAGAGSDLSAVRTVATVDGGSLRIDGEKAYVTNGGFAGLFTVLARTPGLGGERSMSLLCVPREAPGLSIGPEEDKLGVRASSTVSVHFDDARVPLDYILGTAGDGLELAHQTLTWGRMLMAAGCLGTARYALDAAIAHVGSRRQFRRAIGDFDLPRMQVATMDATLWAMESLVDRAARAADTADASMFSAAAKVFCSDGAFTICDGALQLHGAMGFLEPTGVARALRDCRITRIFEGANDVLLVRLGAGLLAREAHAEGAASGHDGLDACERRLSETIAVYRKELGVRATQRQLLTVRLARAAVCILAARASIARAALEPDGADLAAFAVELLSRDGQRQLDALRTLDSDERALMLLSRRAYESRATGRSR